MSWIGSAAPPNAAARVQRLASFSMFPFWSSASNTTLCLLGKADSPVVDSEDLVSEALPLREDDICTPEASLVVSGEVSDKLLLSMVEDGELLSD